VTHDRALVVGASHAGVQLAASLRQEGWAGEVVVVGDELALPYQRPPLSKAYLAGEASLQELAIRKAEFYDKYDIRLVQGTVDRIDRAARQVVLSDGETMGYVGLALCTGGRARTLPVSGSDLPGIFYLRTSADAESIRVLASRGGSVAIVGGGYIGLETAASLRKLGLEVTVLEAAERVLERVTAPEVSAFYERVHRDAGVVIRTGALVESMAGDDRVREVMLASGERIPADLVIVGVGLVPNTELADQAGLAVDNGIVIDDLARTSDPGIVAAGDCASHRMARYDRLVRLESVPSAGEQAKTAAATLCGKQRPIAALPWFWSDQYDLKLQMVGLSSGYDELVVNGDPTRDRDFVCYYLRQGRLLAADCVNRPQDFVRAKRVISQGLEFDRAQVSTPVAP
jgi:3-phenylpropionate/trans-cinnamate dioxygenase ferredoxin reductase component